MLNKFFTHPLYVKVFPNRFLIRDITQQTEHSSLSPGPFTTTRLLVGNFTRAEKALRRGMKSLRRGWFAPAPVIVIQPMAMTEGGLSEVEERAIRELAFSAGARKVIVWVGNALSDQDVLAKLANKA